MKMNVTRLMTIILLSLVGFNEGRAQEQYAILEGFVADAQSGESIPFANVLIRGATGVVISGGSSDLDGNFEINPIPIGEFDVEIMFIGYKKLTFEDFNLKAGRNDLVAMLEIEYYVVAEAELISTCCCICSCPVIIEEEEVFEEVEEQKMSIDNEQLVESSFRIFPNPANDFITLEFAEDVPSIQLVDFNGRILTQTQAMAFQRNQLLVASYPAGFYTLRFFYAGKWESEKIVITH